MTWTAGCRRGSPSKLRAPVHVAQTRPTRDGPENQEDPMAECSCFHDDSTIALCSTLLPQIPALSVRRRWALSLYMLPDKMPTERAFIQEQNSQLRVAKTRRHRFLAVSQRAQDVSQLTDGHPRSSRGKATMAGPKGHVSSPTLLLQQYFDNIVCAARHVCVLPRCRPRGGVPWCTHAATLLLVRVVAPEDRLRMEHPRGPQTGATSGVSGKG